VIDAIKLGKIPSGISTLDTIIRGGIPSGSFVLLLSDVGAGGIEFAVSSAVMLSRVKSEPELYRAVKEQIERALGKEEYFKVPESVCYISFTHSKRDTIHEISLSFPDSFVKVIRDNLVFKDFSSLYYRGSITPSSWIAEKEELDLSTLKSGGGKMGLLEELITFLDTQAPNNLVIIDSLTNLVRACSDTIRWQDLVSFLEGLQRVSKRWDGLIYGLLTSNIFERSKEEEIADCADGVIVFEWSHEGVSQRQQTMYVKKFRGLMPHIEKENIIRFDTTVTSTDGFVVTTVRRISGRR
jgi:KaiC/GvpD/RAD55 family RecA-like ATPase